MESGVEEAARVAREQRKQLLDAMLAKGAFKRKQLIQPRPAGQDKIPLSLAQQRIWFLDQLASDPAVHNVPNATRFYTALDMSALGLAINEVIKRHEVLRTVFDMHDAQLCQVVLPALTVEPVLVDLTQQLSTEPGSSVLFERIDRDVASPFDLRTGPLIRAHVYHCGHDDFVLLMTVHHIVFDAWSIGLLYKEMLTIYRALLEGRAHGLPALSLQYGDFARWQAEQLGGQSWSGQLAYWRDQLVQMPEPLELPFDLSSYAMADSAGAVLPFAVDERVATRLKQLAAANDATLFMVLATAFYVVLHQYSGQSDICIGVPVAGRGRLELEPVIGLFTNMLVIRTQIPVDETFAGLLKVVKKNLLRAYEHQDVPYEKLMELASAERAVGPLFQVVFSMQGTAENTARARVSESQVASVNWHGNRYSKYPFSLFMQDTAEGLVGSFEYQTSLFHKETMHNLSSNFLHLLAQIAEC
ncbi:condensation domain-containing protein [Pseudomonas sp. S3E12]|uniref:condensation domain-containing protein n=1 Tax=Pseudomonas sp. S3E12 TaxID=1873126 RepID=UPI00081BD51D|nr:condensation domain-containing protein [Pseudomonas sp. S3E12]OCW24104.1 hypothetical protein BB029_13455 [Pseudomonas sp. S3E12]